MKTREVARSCGLWSADARREEDRRALRDPARRPRCQGFNVEPVARTNRRTAPTLHPAGRAGTVAPARSAFRAFACGKF